MHKSRTSFFVVSLIAAVLSTGCASKKGAEAGTPAGTDTTTGALGGQSQTTEHVVSSTNWANVASGPLAVVGVVGVGNFDGAAECYASAGPTCGNPASAGANMGTRVFSCASGRCAPENGGRVEAGRILCCGPGQGRGGTMRVAYTQ